jgi:Ca2+-binding RTX toxin-like protein
MTRFITEDVFSTEFVNAEDQIVVTSRGSITSDIAVLGYGKNVISIYGFVAGNKGVVLSEPQAGNGPVGGDSVLVAAGGSIQATIGILARGYDSTILNAGAIGGATGIDAVGFGGTISNTGRIDSLVTSMLLHSFSGTISNTGILSSAGGNSLDTIEGLGAARGGIVGYANFADISNSGTISAVGSNTYGIGLVGTSNSVRNSGLIETMSGDGTDIAIRLVDEGSYIFNTSSGRIVGSIAIRTGDGDDTIVNDGEILGSIKLGWGLDYYDGRNSKFGATVYGEGGPGFLFGGSGNDRLYGGDDMDRLDGGAGADYLAGGKGNDWYSVDSVSDSVWERVGGGEDQVITTSSFVLGYLNDVEVLAAKDEWSVEPIFLVGNDYGQFISGNAGDNRIDGGGSDGGGTYDYDSLAGGRGNDTYLVSSASDVISEYFDEGDADRVMARVSYVLPRADMGGDFEILTTNGSTGKSAINLTGNELAQLIVGNAGTNILSDGGAREADTMKGLGGNDVYRVYNSGDMIVETSGSAAGTGDRVASAVDYALGAKVYVEVMTTNGSTGTSAIDLTGNEIAQQITGNAGSNILDGKGGNDILTGLAGKDFFAFSTQLGAGNVDAITDFNVIDDTIRLDDAIFTALTAGVLQASQFKDNAIAPRDADDRIIYNSNTGSLFYDADGTGAAFAAVKFASLAPGLALTAADFVVI